jgi:hypothetical protein
MPAKIATITAKSAIVRKLERFEAKTGIPVDFCVEEALNNWIESSIPMYLCAIERHRQEIAAEGV